MTQRLQELVQPVLAEENLELVDLQYRREKPGWVLRLFIDRVEGEDGPEGLSPVGSGVTLDDCCDVSREIGRLLDVEEVIPGAYTLEVSSPGLDRPLTKEKDFERFSGRLVRVKASGPEGRRTLKGRLIGLEGGLIRLDVQGQEATVAFEQAEWVRLEPEVDWSKAT